MGSRRVIIPELRRNVLRTELLQHYRQDQFYQRIVSDLRTRHRTLIPLLKEQFLVFDWVEAEFAPQLEQRHPGNLSRVGDQATLPVDQRAALGLYRDELREKVTSPLRLTQGGTPAPWALAYLHADILALDLVIGEAVPAVAPQEVRLTLQVHPRFTSIKVEPTDYATAEVFPIDQASGRVWNTRSLARRHDEPYGTHPYAFTEWDELEEQAISVLKSVIQTMKRRYNDPDVSLHTNEAAAAQRSEDVAALFRWLLHGRDTGENSLPKEKRDRIRKNITAVIGLDLPPKRRTR